MTNKQDECKKNQTVPSTVMFVAGSKSDFTDTNTTGNEFNITEESIICRWIVCLTYFHKVTFTEAVLSF